MEKKIFIALLNTFRAHKEKAREGFNLLDVSEGMPKVLYVLHDNEGIVQKDLAKLCNITPPTLTNVLKRMEKQDLIRKEGTTVSGGKHAIRIFTTETGHKKYEKIYQLVESLEAQSFIGFSEEEKQQLFSLLERVAENLNSKNVKHF